MSGRGVVGPAPRAPRRMRSGALADVMVAIWILAALIAIEWTRLFIQELWHTPHSYDFGSFYRSGLAWNAGYSAYQDPRQLNLNPPWLLPTLFGPLARLSMHHAVRLWTALNLVLVVWQLRIVQRTLHLSVPETLRIGIGMALTYAWIVHWQQGQITWILGVLVTQAWAWARTAQPIRSGILIGIALAIKPTLVLAVIAIGWVSMLTAGATSAAIVVGSTLWIGVTPWRDWIVAVRSVSWYADAPNVSLLAELARIQGTHIRDIITVSHVAVIGLMIVGMAMVGRSLCVRETDRRWTAGLVQAVLLSPRGWTFYLLDALGPFLAVTCRGSLARLLPWGLLVAQNFAAPMVGLGQWAHALWGLLGCAAACWMWSMAAWPRPKRSSPCGTDPSVNVRARL